MEIMKSLLSDNIGYLNALRHAQAAPLITTSATEMGTTQNLGNNPWNYYLPIGLGLIGLGLLFWIIYENNNQKKKQQN